MISGLDLSFVVNSVVCFKGKKHTRWSKEDIACCTRMKLAMRKIKHECRRQKIGSSEFGGTRQCCATGFFQASCRQFSWVAFVSLCGFSSSQPLNQRQFHMVFYGIRVLPVVLQRVQEEKSWRAHIVWLMFAHEVWGRTCWSTPWWFVFSGLFCVSKLSGENQRFVPFGLFEVFCVIVVLKIFNLWHWCFLLHPFEDACCIDGHVMFLFCLNSWGSQVCGSLRVSASLLSVGSVWCLR